MIVDIFLYAGEASATDIRLRDPTILNVVQPTKPAQGVIVGRPSILKRSRAGSLEDVDAYRKIESVDENDDDLDLVATLTMWLSRN